MTRIHTQADGVQCLQRGAALIVLFLAILMAGTLILVTHLAIDKGRTGYEEKTSQALAQAKEALISHAISFHKRRELSSPHDPLVGYYGFLPCPDTGGEEGNSAGTCAGRYENSLGRFPWRTLDMDPLKDASGQCLWYAVTGNYKFSGGSTRSHMHNEDSPGRFILHDANNTVLHGSDLESQVVAVVIAPGPVLPGQARGAVEAGNPCVVPNDIAIANPGNYLEGRFGHDNSGVVTNIDDENYHLISANSLTDETLNDRMITITAGEIFNAIRAQSDFQDKMQTTTEQLAQCVAYYGQDMFTAMGGGSSGACPELCSACYDVCDAAFDCDAVPPGPGRGQCNQDRNACRQACRDSGCVNNVNQMPPNCGSGPNLPWAAPVDLNGADYRVTANYIDVAGANYGRFPFDIQNSHSAITTTVAYLDNLFAHCATVLPGLSDLNNEYRRIYDHWKDHIFYAVSQDFAPGGDGDCNPAANCITYNRNGNALPLSAILLYAGERQNQLRRAEPPAAPVNDATSKGVLGNYLESGNYPAFDTAGSNDYAVCIDTANSTCPCDQLVIATSQCPTPP